MKWKALLNPLRSSHTHRTAGFVLPPVMLEVQPDFVLAARLDAGAGEVRRLAFAPLDSQTLSAHPARANIGKEDLLLAAIHKVVEVVGGAAGRRGLLISDGSIRTGVMPFETLPDGKRDLDTLVRWRLKGLVPYPPEEARVSFQVAPVAPAGFEVLAMAGRQSVIRQYEAAMEHLEGRSELVLPATAALLPLLPGDTPEPQLLLHVCSGWLTSVVVLGDRVPFWRTREVGPGNEGPAGNGVANGEGSAFAENISREASRVLASVCDHLKLEIGRVWLCHRALAAYSVASVITAATSLKVEELDLGSEAASALGTSERAILDRFGAPLVGLLANSL